MSYEPTVWKDGDLVTATKLNKMEQGIAGSGGCMVVNATIDGNDTVLDKTYAEITNALTNGIFVYVLEPYGDETSVHYIERYGYYNMDASFYFVKINSNRYTCSSIDGYPCIGNLVT